MENLKYSSFHNHDSFSMLDGLDDAKIYIDKSIELGLSSFGITNHGNTSSVLHYYDYGKKKGFPVMMGSEFYIESSDIVYQDEDKRKNYNKYYHLIVLAKNKTGYQNLMKLSSMSFDPKRFYTRPRITFEDLFQHKDGLICTSACMLGPIAQLVLKDKYEEAWNLAKTFKKEFNDDWFIEIEVGNTSWKWDKDKGFYDTGINSQEVCNKGLIQIGQDLKIPIVIGIDAHMANKESKKVQDIAIQTGSSNGWHFHETYYLKTVKEIWEECQTYHKYISEDDFKKWLTNTNLISEKCNVVLEFPVQIPKVEKNTINDLYSILQKRNRVVWNDSRYIDRLKHEINVITNNGKINLLDYFFVLEDLISWCEKNQIEVGVGRGSAVGSLLVYAMGITSVDPIKYDLLFERFLSLPRIQDGSLPDIDIDFSDPDKVKEYLRSKYGEDKVYSIGTVQQIKIKNAFTDVCRVILGNEFDYWQNKELAKGLPSTGPNAKLELILRYVFEGINFSEDDHLKEQAAHDGILSNSYTEEDAEKWRKWIRNHPKGLEIYEVMLKILGTPRQSGVHASALAISERPMCEIVPTAFSKGTPVTQFTAPWCEYAGILKFDILGLSTLKDFQECKNLIKENYTFDVDITKISTEDARTLHNFTIANTDTVFQFNTHLQKKMLKDIGANCLNDLAAVTAIARPGPLGNEVDKIYIEGKKNPENIKYDHPLMKEVVGDTYGALIYQEQVMKFFNVMGGCSLTEAEQIRRSISKGKADILRKYESNFIEHVTNKIEPSLSEEKARDLWSKIEKYSAYSFNKCLSGDEKILFPDGKKIEVRELYYLKKFPYYAYFCCRQKEHFQYCEEGYGKALSMDENFRIIPNEIKKIMYEGIKDIYQLETADCRKIRTTSNHKFPTPSGDKMLSELSPGDYVYTVIDLGEGKKYADPVKITKIEYVKTGDVYDVEMEAPYHNFVTGDNVVTCNSHATAYAYIAYVCQFFKTNFPKEWWCAVFRNSTDDDFAELIDKVPPNIKIQYPEINESDYNFFINKNGDLVIPISKLKGIGPSATEEIVKKRPYKDFTDFLEKVEKKTVKKNVVLNLIFGGVFDKISVGLDRLELARQYYTYRKETLPDEIASLTAINLLERESEILTFKSVDYVSLFSNLFNPKIIDYQSVRLKLKGHGVYVGGKIFEKKSKKTKKNKTFYDLILNNRNDKMLIHFWDEEHFERINELKASDIVEIYGEVNIFNGTYSLNGRSIRVLNINQK